VECGAGVVAASLRVTRVGRCLTTSFPSSPWQELAVIVTPGPDTALTIRNTLMGGRRSGTFTAIGVAAGQPIGPSLLPVVSRCSPRLRASFSRYQARGAAYLAFLGAQALYGALRIGSAGTEVLSPAPSHQLPPRVALRQGLISNLTNPQDGHLFPALLPQFAPEGVANLLVLLVLGLTFAMMTVVWLTGYAYAVSKAGRLPAPAADPPPRRSGNRCRATRTRVAYGNLAPVGPSHGGGRLSCPAASYRLNVMRSPWVVGVETTRKEHRAHSSSRHGVPGPRVLTGVAAAKMRHDRRHRGGRRSIPSIARSTRLRLLFGRRRRPYSLVPASWLLAQLVTDRLQCLSLVFPFGKTRTCSSGSPSS